MTEDTLVAALREIVEAPARGRVPGPRPIVLGIGDDAAVWQPSRSHLSVITTDALVDGVHFASEQLDARTIGHRAMAANLSDIAAMGARPVLVTVALGVAPQTTESWILECYRGMAALAERHGACIVGGDLVRAPAVTLALTVVGEVSRSRLKRRSGGRPGDVLAVTGALGASRAGLEVLRQQGVLALDEDSRRTALAAFATPQPRVAEGRWLSASANVNAMMDSSDGLSTDLGRLAAASGCGAAIERVPVDPSAAAVASAAGGDARAYALDGGEDFELLVAVAPRAFAHLARRFARRFGRPLLAVGRLEAVRGLRARDGDGERPLAAAGFDHFASGGSQ
ncbi:MAG: thiamine-phosphate kinase [Candidatus Eremiobacteraeota bacterium]|nr:thiamine-phosphate kinase [Candidatus Eremiobacteraeota bacterium]